MTTIPIIDMAPLQDGSVDSAREVAQQLLDAAESIGFFYVRNHGVSRETIARTEALARRFFALPLEEKQQVKVTPWHRGYIEIGEAKMYDGAKIDLKESFVWGMDADSGETAAVARARLRGPNQWPAALPEMRDALNLYLDAANRCGKVLLRAFAASLGLRLDHFTQRFNRPITRGSLVFYPPQPPGLGDDQFGVAPHTDYGCITLVHQDPIGGLEVRGRSGDWLTAHPIEDTLVVNVGDLMARWTNELFKSTPHRVINRSSRERLSIAAFVDPDYETPVVPVTGHGQPPLFEPVTCGDYIVSRFDASFAYRSKNSPSAR